MKPLLAVLMLFAGTAFADQITFSFIGNTNTQNVAATQSAFDTGPGLNVLVTDASTGQSFALPGIFTTSAGPAHSYTVTTNPNLVLASYSAGNADSVLITSPDGRTVLVAGINNGRGTFVSSYPNGTGAFLSDFTVTAVDPAVLAMFGLGPGFDRRGSVSITSGTGNLIGFDHLAATLGGGSVTIETSAVSEPAGLGLAGMGVVALAGLRKLRWFEGK